MNKTYIILFPARAWMKIAALLASLVAGFTSMAQQGSSGNTYIFGGAEMTFFGAHDFVNGGNGALPGVVGAVRGPSSIGILNFTSTASQSGASDAAHVDGYVRKYGSTPFVFPVGDNGFYGPFAASGNGTVGAYYHVDASVAITSDLGGGNYPVLPAGGPFPVATFEDALEAVSPVEYWDINGNTPTTLTLTWDAGSAISTLTAGQLNKLTIAGWNGSQWVAIPSTVDVTSILGGTSDLTAGSITTTAALAPDTYTAYTFASRDAPLPVTLTTFTVQAEGNSVVLYWSTTVEANSDRFEIERSGNGKLWSQIGTINSHEESHVLINYKFVDQRPETGNNFYRLKMVDNDGTFAYSRIRSVEFNQLGSWITYPNPVTDKLYLKDPASVTKIVILNGSGSAVYQSSQITSGELNVSSLNPGIHIVQTTSRNGTQTVQKVLIRR